MSDRFLGNLLGRGDRIGWGVIVLAAIAAIIMFWVPGGYLIFPLGLCVFGAGCSWISWRRFKDWRETGRWIELPMILILFVFSGYLLVATVVFTIRDLLYE